MPLKLKNTKRKKIVFMVIILGVIVLMLISFGTTQRMVETVLYPAGQSNA
jgi:accessory gene regulator protein AgrB